MTPGRPASGESSDTGASFEEDVLEVAPVGLEPHQAQAEVGGDVADEVVDRPALGELGWRRVDGDHRAARPAGEPSLGQRLAETVPLGLGADHLDQQAAGLLEEVAGGAAAQQVAAV